MRAKQYRIPTISGYFSNLSSIEQLAILHDSPVNEKQHELQLYFNDLYQVLIHQLSQYAITDNAPESEEDKLAAMFLELVKTKRALRKNDKPS